MAKPTTGPQTPDGLAQATAMGGQRSNGNAPQPALGMPVQASTPWLPNGGLQFTPKPAAVAPGAPGAPKPMAAMGAGLQAHSAPGAPVNHAAAITAADPYSYNATTGQTGGEDHNTQEQYQQGQIERAQNNLGGAVAGFGDQERQKFQIQVGNLLGQQNSIGGLRSGGVEQGVADFGDQFGREVGDYAAQTAVAGQAQGLDANQQISDITMANQARKDKKGAGLMNAIGTGLGIAGGIAMHG